MSKKRRWYIISALVIGVVAAFFVGGFGAIGVDTLRSGPTKQGSPAATPDVQAMVRQVICQKACRIVDQQEFAHPAWGKSVLFVTKSVDTDSAAEGNLAVIDSTGAIKWHYTSSWPEIEIAEPPQDASGNLFVNYNPGRYNGVIVLKPNNDSFEHFDSLPPEGDYQARFYYAVLSDDDRDGTYEIVKSHNDCEPSCAEGTITSVTYRWTGADYHQD